MNIKRCVLHAGMHKTGSSSIQRYLFNTSNDETDYEYGNLNNFQSGYGLVYLLEGERTWLEQRLGGISMAEDYYAYDGDPNALREEADMFHFEPDTLHWLADQINSTPVVPNTGEEAARAVAMQVQTLFLLLIQPLVQPQQVQQPKTWRRWLNALGFLR